MFKLNLRNIRLDPELDFDILADNTENFSGADVHLLSHGAHAQTHRWEEHGRDIGTKELQRAGLRSVYGGHSDLH